MSSRAVDPARSRLVLLGTARYRDPELPDVPQIDANAEGISVAEVGDRLEEAAGQAENLLLLYYSGHGVLGPRGELHLALTDTRRQNPSYSGLRIDTDTPVRPMPAVNPPPKPSPTAPLKVS
ncbi:hypothetical protein Pflav_018340 [Phytohabitans flavus]|uniref:Caspase family p20 domain-containing protein n=1 Tax=Phytohabitans flavus TaxID=1076124 RepID=A0A6F8XNL6_9ACTN|nr:hypothetical protein [Phytohabitans flavus]BCB75424.1 hypothetical protein Pflav_018340 [Phytohabitans flavus]